MITTTILFFTLQLINVILQTIKSIITITGTKQQASICNAITYGFYTIIVQQMATLPLPMTVTVTIITNYIGVYISKFIMDKTRKINLWKISVTAHNPNKLIERFKPFGIQYKVNPIQYKNKTYYDVTLYSYKKEDSKIIKDILSTFNYKYNVTEITKNL